MASELRTGTFESTLDDKGRVVIPASLRESYQGKLVITYGWYSCVWIQTIDEYETFMKNMELNLTSSMMSNDQYEAFQYLLDSPATEAVIDSKSGRIPIPAAIRTHIGLSKDCLVLSINRHLRHLEIWNTEAYHTHMNQMQMKVQDAMQNLGPVHFFPKEGQV